MIVQENDKLVAVFDIDLGKKAVIADDETVKCIENLKAIKSQLKLLEAKEKELSNQIRKMMDNKELLFNDDGTELATYKVYSGAVSLHVGTLKEIFPDVYKDCLTKSDDYRKLIIK